MSEHTLHLEILIAYSLINAHKDVNSHLAELRIKNCLATTVAKLLCLSTIGGCKMQTSVHGYSSAGEVPVLRK